MCFFERTPYFFRGTDRYGALGDDQSVIAHVLTDLGRYSQNIFQIGGAILARRGADSDERYFASLHGRGQVGGESQSLLLEVAFDDHIQSRLINGQDAFFQIFDLFHIHIYAADIQTYICQTCTGYKANIACSYNYDFHTDRLLLR